MPSRSRSSSRAPGRHEGNNRPARSPSRLATLIGIRFVQPRQCAFENIERGTKSVDFRHATQIHESHDFCRMGVCPVCDGALRTPHLLGVGSSCRVRSHPAVRINAVLERACPDHIAEHSRGAAITATERTAIRTIPISNRTQFPVAKHDGGAGTSDQTR